MEGAEERPDVARVHDLREELLEVVLGDGHRHLGVADVVDVDVGEIDVVDRHQEEPAAVLPHHHAVDRVRHVRPD
jgi:hypothetical protein